MITPEELVSMSTEWMVRYEVRKMREEATKQSIDSSLIYSWTISNLAVVD